MPVESAATTKDESSTDGYDQAADEAPEDDGYDMDGLDGKLLEHFAGKIVRKDLTALMKRGANVPTFVLEYLLGMTAQLMTRMPWQRVWSASAGSSPITMCVPMSPERIKSKIRELGRFTIIDKVTAKLDEYKDIYVASFANLTIEPFVMPAEYVRDYSKILQGGIWCIMSIEYRHPVDEEDEFGMEVFGDDAPRRSGPSAKKRGPEDSPFSVASLTPIQMPNLDLDAMIVERQYFTRGRVAQYAAALGWLRTQRAFRRKSACTLSSVWCRSSSATTTCANWVPAAPARAISTKRSRLYAILLSGGQTTTANLFGRMNSMRADRVGLVGHWDCVTFDEVAGMRFKDTNAVQIMKDYMASGSYARGRDQINADASMVFEGNINDTVQNVLKTTHLFDPFPPEFNNDSAFFDRIHYYLPGWEIPKMRSEPADRALRPDHRLPVGVLQRDAPQRTLRTISTGTSALTATLTSVTRSPCARPFSGLAKLLFPDEAMDKDGDALAAGLCHRGPSPRKGAAQDYGGRRVYRR